ncbi:cytochrome P450 [Caulobacter sp. Root1472]|uniref:cytochrome P450 n=1 Tax=Caulobacter sp. Root1472 TaxID=1736470 RepID=UPI0006FACE84|nr:cytochrome P450 [Caulobacter sp. Root1472]KQZ28320.1 cytochrome [Caulobacter sp. Root1472]
MSHLPRRIEDLPSLEPAELAGWAANLDGSLVRLFERYPDGLAQGAGSRLLVFGAEPLRRIAATEAAGNMPADVLSSSAFNVGPDGAPVEPEIPAASSLAKLVSNQVFTANPPLHGPTRQLFMRQFVPKQLPRFAGLIEATVATLLQEAGARTQVDFGTDVAERLTARFWAQVLGLTADEEARARHLISALSPMFYLVRTPDETLSADAAAAEYLDMVSAAVERGLSQGDNPLLQDMAADFSAILQPGRPESLGMMLAANLIDGFHTAAVAAVNAVYGLVRNPEVLAKVRADQSLVPAAFFETIRLNPPVVLTQRYALRDFDYDGLTVPVDTPLVMLWIAGNRDPKAFAEPNRIDLSRPQRGDGTFGGGAHICPGRNIARALVEAVLRGVTAPGVQIEAAAAMDDWMPRSSMRQLSQSPMRVSVSL